MKHSLKSSSPDIRRYLFICTSHFIAFIRTHLRGVSKRVNVSYNKSVFFSFLRLHVNNARKFSKCYRYYQIFLQSIYISCRIIKLALTLYMDVKYFICIVIHFRWQCLWLFLFNFINIHIKLLIKTDWRSSADCWFIRTEQKLLLKKIISSINS